MTRLPVDDVLDDVRAALASPGTALLVAPPGAGKTTRIAPALLNEDWCDGEILLLVPRRIAARAAGDYMAQALGERAGQTVGYATRLDSRPGRRITVMTHGVFLARIQRAPDLPGVSAVLFDEVHERSLDSDLALAFALESRAALREELRLVAMSATLDVAAFRPLFPDAPLIESEGRSFPLTLHHVGRDAAQPVEPQMARAIRTALGEHEGSLLAFLPGVREIERTATALGDLPPDIVLHRLHGQVDPAAQRAALAAPPDGRRKVVLASAIAETSVTVNDVAIVVDSGLARRPRFDVGAGLTRLVTERASRAAVTQRAGRAARQRPGVAIRLWEEAANASLPPHDPPEIAEADLAPLLLSSLAWGEADPVRLPLPTPPPAAALDAAWALLEETGAVRDCQLTDHGKAMAALPLAPRLAHMLLVAAARGFGATAALAALLLSERGLGGRGEDLESRAARAVRETGRRAKDALALALARRWAQLVEASERVDPARVGQAIALAFPARVARRRSASGERWQSVGGRGFSLDPASPLARHEWLAIAEVAGAAAGARILSAAPIDEAVLLDLLADRLEARSEIRFDPELGGVRAQRKRRLGAITLSAAPDPEPDAEQVADTLLRAVEEHGLDLLPLSAGIRALLTRATFARQKDSAIPDLSPEALVERRGEWLAPLLDGVTRFAGLDPAALQGSIEALAGYDALRRIDTLAPPRLATPAGSSHAIDYDAPAGPTVEVRPQALYGMDTHPMVGTTPLVLSLTSPAGRPIQTTTDLPAFWRGSWADVAKDMRGRYPRHHWPDDPASARPDLRTKNAQKRRP